MHQIELPIIEVLQNIFKVLQPVWLAITFLGDETFYLLFMPMIYWCVDALAGFRIGIVLIFSSFLNGFLKMIFKSPRPFWVSDRIEMTAHHDSFGLPSGHAMNSAAVWGWTARELNRPWAHWVLAILIFLIGFSRIVLGVHFISDVLLGWLIGALLVWLLASRLKMISQKLDQMSFKSLLGLILLSTFLFIALPAAVHLLNHTWQIPAEWLALAGAIDPMNMEGALTTAGLWAGMLAGFVILRHQRGLLVSDQGTWQKLLRYIIGLVGVFALYAGLGSIFPDDAGLLSMFLRLLRYTLIGFWVSWWSPLLFEKIKIGVIRPHIRPETTAPK